MLFLLGLFDECVGWHELVRFDHTETDSHATTQPASETLFASRVALERWGIRRRGNSRFSGIQQQWFSEVVNDVWIGVPGEAKDSTNSTRRHYIWGVTSLQALRIASRLGVNPDTTRCVDATKRGARRADAAAARTASQPPRAASLCTVIRLASRVVCGLGARSARCARCCDVSRRTSSLRENTGVASATRQRCGASRSRDPDRACGPARCARAPRCR